MDALKKVNFELYGRGYSGKASDNIHYNGAFEPNELIKHLQGSFGLVWDGFSIDGCEGNYGLYLKYYNPHKLFLYFAAGLPVIIWDKAALAEIVKTMGFGFTISKLSDIEVKSEMLTKKEYQSMCKQVKKIAVKIRAGGFLDKAIEKVVDSDI